MALKRKRSSATFSSPSSDISHASHTTTSSTKSTAIPFFYQQTKPVEALYQKPTWSFPTYEDQGSTRHLNSRTRKRHRDDRPDDQVVHANTISRLYDAQRQYPGMQPIWSQLTRMPQVASELPQKSTLHSFWRIPLQQPTSLSMPPDVRSSSPSILETKCEDCDRALRHEDAMDVDYSLVEQDTACSMCGRHICDTCAVLGDTRVCLTCVGSGTGR